MAHGARSGSVKVKIFVMCISKHAVEPCTKVLFCNLQLSLPDMHDFCNPGAVGD